MTIQEGESLRPKSRKERFIDSAKTVLALVAVQELHEQLSKEFCIPILAPGVADAICEVAASEEVRISLLRANLEGIDDIERSSAVMMQSLAGDAEFLMRLMFGALPVPDIEHAG